MTANEFRKLALSFPDTVESAHMDHPDFRVGGKIFATLGPGEKWGVLKLTPEQQRVLIHAEPMMFEPIKGGWGAKGATKVLLGSSRKEAVRQALAIAWRNTAPKRLSQQFQG